MLYTKIQPKRFHGSGEEDFQDMVCWPSCSVFEQIDRAHVRSGENWSERLYDFIHVYSPEARADNP